MVASQRFTAGDREAIRQAVAEAEARTTGEIVPVVATASSEYERAEDTFGVLLGVVLVAATWLLFQRVEPARADWSTHWDVTLPLYLVLALFVVGWILGVFLAQKVPFLKRLAATRWLLTTRVQAAAELAFDRFHVRGTRASTGIVIYVSLFERMVFVEADGAIAEKVTPEEWKDICDGMIAAMRAKRHREGFVEAIKKCGDLLARHFPMQAGDTNELTNDLRFMD